MTRIEVVVFPGSEELDIFGPFEVLKAAERECPGLSVALVALGAPREVRLALGTRLLVEESPSERPDVLVIPGGGWITRSGEGAFAQAQRGELPALIARAHAAGSTIASVCTGAMLVAAAALAKGRPMTTHAGALEDLRAAGARIADARVVDDGDLVSAGGITSGIDLGLWLLERFFSAEVAARLEVELEHERRGAVHRR